MRKWLGVLALAGVLLLSACKDGKEAAQEAAAAAELTVLAGSELKDIEPLLPQIEAATGIRLKLHYAGTLDAVERLQDEGQAYDFAWLASNKYALLTPAAKARIRASERTMLSPVVIGIKTSVARTLGWADAARPPSWADIARACGEGRLRLAMTSPASSNTGFAAVLGLASALAGKGEALELADIDFAAQARFARAQTVTAGSSGWLADTYVREEARLDGLVNYASVLQALAPKLSEPLTLVYPKDGVITADYPFMLLREERRADYDRLVAYLRGKEFQQAMTASTYRQPVHPEVQAAGSKTDYFELAFPARLEVIDGLLDAYLHAVRRPADSTFIVDVSGSMQGERIEQLRKSLQGLAGADSSLTGRYARLRDRERIALVRFSDHVEDQQVWELGKDRQRNDRQLQAFSDYAGQLQTTGGTAIYTAAKAAYEAALVRQHRDPDRTYTLLLMTDGKNNEGLSAKEFLAWFAALPPERQRIRIFAVRYGEARSEELDALTQPTGGRVFDANKHGLQAAFKEIRGYQ
ncbi:substrate-binding and VWA domain-containing protein [Chitinilyticum litopenaei]|uniref:substrate-binding and VWA domain-containing protein n=1 Tax=Chitinilyticum litopenaei TaxID=1121276 RepID=UPI0004280474|nr:substrate-binding and VWA domain-containing protein [Chitinilyticum litopenaei]